VSTRDDIFWRLFVLVNAGLFHALLMLHGARYASLSGPLTLQVWAWLAVTALLLLVTFLALLWESRVMGPLCAAATALLPVPWYLLMLPFSWTLGVCGAVVCVLTAVRVMRPVPSRRGADTDVAAGPPSPEPEAGAAAPGAQTWGEAIGAAAALSVLAGLIVLGYGWKPGPVGTTLFWVLLVSSTIAGLAWELTAVRPLRKRRLDVRLLLPLAAVICLVNPETRPFTAPLLLLRQIGVLWVVWRTHGGARALWDFFVERPAHLLVSSFAAAILLGALFLSLPAATRNQTGLSPVDALFTSTSATCVTGLIVVDTGSDLSRFGQAVVLTLIQAGGLGIMTVSTFIALLLGRNIGLREEFALTRTLGEERSLRAKRLVWFIMLFTFIFESIGAALLALDFFGAGIPWPACLWTGVFHSVSAFCNAGFSLFSDSLVRFSKGPHILIPLIVSLLIIVGGLGFGVIYSLLRALTERRRPGLHVRIVLGMTAILLASGAVILWLLEHGRTFSGGGIGTSFVHAWFQSVTARTAGFNTVPIGEMRSASLLVLMVLMFIGAAPGSTAGGVKVTTVAVLWAAAAAVMRGRTSVVMSARRIAPRTVLNAALLVCVAGTGIVIVCILLTITEEAPVLPLLFEAVSAFGTVGLSCGVTPHLTVFGKLCLIVLMFAGRVGPLTLLVMMQPRRVSAVEYPIADVAVG